MINLSMTDRAIAKELGNRLKQRRLNKDEIIQVVANWPDFAREAGVSPEAIKYVGRHHLRENDFDTANTFQPQ